jgi:proteasome lid subunit RPN8/RPN11
MLKISAEALEQMVEHCEQEYPNEACGNLAGKGELASAVYPIANDAASPTWYEMNTSQQLKAQKEIRREGMSHLAVYHSHVATEAYPSPRDVERATAVQDFFDGLYVLVTLKEKGRPKARAFRIHDGHVQEEPIA